MTNYYKYIIKKGLRVSEINPGSSEYALGVSDALDVVKLIRGKNVAVLGGDILTNKDGELIYAYQFWGSSYHYLNWHCDQSPQEPAREYISRSQQLAENSIELASKTAESLNQNCYVVLILKEIPFSH